MEPFRRFTAVAAPLDAVNVDTDQIIPARFLKYPRGGGAGYGGFLFHDMRFDEAGRERPDFILNRGPFRAAGIIVGNLNLGSGSSREGAVYALSDHGVRALVAPGFGDIFFNNCLKNGVVPVRLSPAICADIRAELHASPGRELCVDLEAMVLDDGAGGRHAFEIDPFRRALLLDGVDELGLTIGLGISIAAFTREYAARFPWLCPAKSEGLAGHSQLP